MQERKSLKNYLNAVRNAKINIHKFSVENKSQITHSLEFTKSIDNFTSQKPKKVSNVTVYPTETKLPKNPTTKSPYRAEIFNIKGVKRVKPLGYQRPVQKSRALIQVLSRNHNSRILQKFLKQSTKSTERNK